MGESAAEAAKEFRRFSAAAAKHGGVTFIFRRTYRDLRPPLAEITARGIVLYIRIISSMSLPFQPSAVSRKPCIG